MALVLAIESNSTQADTLRHVLRAHAGIDVVVVGSQDAAVEALDQRVPDLVLVGALLSPRDEDALNAHLRTLPDAGHLQTLTIPRLRQTSGTTRRGLSIFGHKKRRADEATGGCDPKQFGDEVAGYLSRACNVKAEIEAHKAATRTIDGKPPVVDCPEPVEPLPSVSAAAPPQPDASRLPVTSNGPESARSVSEDALPRADTPREPDTILETEAAATHAAAMDQLRADAEQTIAAERHRVRADAAQTVAAELAAAEERHRDEIAHLEAEAAESRDAASQDAQAQADETLAAELNRVRTDAERTLANALTAAEARHSADIARLEAEATATRDAAARDAQAAAKTLANETLAAELDRVRADAERTLANALTVAEVRHSADIARLEAEAAEKGATATQDAEAHEDERLSAGREPLGTDDGLALADELAAAQERHYANIAHLEAEAAGKRDAATRDAQVAAETLAAETLTAERERGRTEAERTLAGQLDEAEERHSAEIAWVRDEARKTFAEQLERARAEANAARAEAARRAPERPEVDTRDPRAAADRDPMFAPVSPEPGPTRSLRSLPTDLAQSNGMTDYYDLWRTCYAAGDTPPAETAPAGRRRVNPRRRRWALLVAATVLILFTTGLGIDSRPRDALAAGEPPGASHVIGALMPVDRDGAWTAPVPEEVGLPDRGLPATWEDPDTGASRQAPLRQRALGVLCLLTVMLLLRVVLSIGEGLVWHGLVVTLGLVLLGFVLMRTPWSG